MRRRSAGVSKFSTGSPPKRTSPLSGSISRLTSFSAVVFPDPDGPTMATKERPLMLSDTSRSAWVLPASKDLATWMRSMRGAGGMGHIYELSHDYDNK